MERKSESMKDHYDIPVESKNFFEKAEEQPCQECHAHCCRMLLIPHPTPTTFMDLDYIRYMIGFQNVGVILNSNGQWQVFVEEDCQLLDQEANLCTVHNTSKKPKTCVFFNPHLDMEAMEIILPHVRFDGDGNIIEIPKWEYIWDLINKDGSQEVQKGQEYESCEAHDKEKKRKPSFEEES